MWSPRLAWLHGTFDVLQSPYCSSSVIVYRTPSTSLLLPATLAVHIRRDFAQDYKHTRLCHSTIAQFGRLPKPVPFISNGPDAAGPSDRDGQHIFAPDTTGGPIELCVFHTLGFSAMDSFLSSTSAQELDWQFLQIIGLPAGSGGRG
jgi:hypothetical protein